MDVPSDSNRKLAATCRICSRPLTLGEFRACSGVGHYCTAHLAAVAGSKPTRARQRRSAGSTAGKRGRHISESGVTEYSCKGQFAADGVIRRGKLTSEHASCLDGDVVFVCNDVGHGPGEIVALYISDPKGRVLAERTGYACQ